MTGAVLLFFAPVLFLVGMYACPRLWRLLDPEREIDRGGFGSIGEQRHWHRGG